METIRVELTPATAERRQTLTVFRGETDITEQVLRTSMIALRSYIPAANRGYISIGRQRHTTLEQYLRDGGYRYGGEGSVLPAAILCDAIRAYVTELVAEGSTVSVTEDQEAVVAALAAAEPSFLTIGGRMYRLQATEHSDAGIKLLRKAREQAAAAVRAHRDAAMARTTAECAVARQQIDRERLQLVQDRAEFARGGQMVIPPWLGRKEVISDNAGWLFVKQTFSYVVTKFVIPEYTMPPANARERDNPRVVSLEWDALTVTTPPVTVTYWLKVNPTLQSYDVGHSYVDRGSPQLPHAGHGGFCVQPDGMPQRVTRWEDAADITNRIARAFRVVNLSSLLHTDAVGDVPTRAFTPAGVRQLVRCELDVSYHLVPGVRIVDRDRPAQVWEATALPAPEPEAGTTAAAWQAAGQRAPLGGLIEHIAAIRRAHPEMGLTDAVVQAREELNEENEAPVEIADEEPEEENRD